MALIKCKECGKEISDQAKTCPHCGYENIKKGEKKVTSKSNYIKTGSIVSLISCSFIVLIIIWLVVSSIVPDKYTSPNIENNQSNDFEVNVQLSPSYVEFDQLTFVLISLIAGLICFVITILYLSNKFKNIKVYKILLVSLAIIQFITGIFSINPLGCCGIVYLLFPTINVTGAIIAACGKENEN